MMVGREEEAVRMVGHSEWRIARASAIGSAFITNSMVEACFVFGSAATGWADSYSDVELGVVWARLPSSDELREIASEADIEAWTLEAHGDRGQAWLEQFTDRGMRVEVGHWSRDGIDDIVTRVVESHDTSQRGLVFENQTTAFILQHSHVLHGADLIGQWRARLAPYPLELAMEMVRSQLTFLPFHGQEILTARGEIPMLYENRCAIVRRVLNILFGLNRIYHPGFKWTRHFVDRMTVKPDDFYERLEKVFRSNTRTEIDELRRLVEDTFDLVEEHLPQVELKTQRESFSRRYPEREPPVLGGRAP